MTYTVTRTVDGTAIGTLSNTATVTLAGDTQRRQQQRHRHDDRQPGRRPLDHQDRRRHDGGPRHDVTYTITAANAGPATATAASVTDTFPAACTCGELDLRPDAAPAPPAPPGRSPATSPTARPCRPAPRPPTPRSARWPTPLPARSSTPRRSAAAASPTPIRPTTAPATPTRSCRSTTATPRERPGTAVGLPDARRRERRPPRRQRRRGAAPGRPARHRGRRPADRRRRRRRPVSVPNVDDEDGVTLPATLVACGTANVDSQRLGGGEARRLRRLEPQRQLRRRRREHLRQPGVGGGGERPALQRPLHRHADGAHLRPLPLRPPAACRPTGVAADGEVEDYRRRRARPRLRRRSHRLSDPARRQRRSACRRRPARLSSARPSTPKPTASRPPAPTAMTSPSSDDEDGVAFTSPLIRGQNASVTVTASARRACSTPGSTSTATATGRPPGTRSSSTWRSSRGPTTCPSRCRRRRPRT